VGLSSLTRLQDLFQRTNWNFLSPGQRQCLLMTRILYHNPTVVVLDETSSQMDIQSEANIYGICKSKGIIVLSIGHRVSLQQYHQNIYFLNNINHKLELLNQ